MNPSSSAVETGFASSAIKRADVCGVAVVGMSERNSPVLESGSRIIGGLCNVSGTREELYEVDDFCGRLVFDDISAVARFGSTRTGLDAFGPSSTSPIQQRIPRKLGCFGLWCRSV